MKVQVIIAERFKVYFIDRLELLFGEIARRLNTELEYNTHPVIYKDTDIVITYGLPYHAIPGGGYPELINMPKHIKLISVLADVWSHGNKEYEYNASKIYERSDVLLTAIWDGMEKLWDEFIPKCEFFPNYISPTKRYDLPLNETPINKMVLSGMTMASFYPLRDYVLKNVNSAKIFRPPHPGFHNDYKTLANNKSVYVTDNYANMLNQYSCGLSTTTIHTFLTFKFLEMGAVGCLPISDSCDDMQKCGFYPGMHYMEIDKENSIDIIDHVLNNPIDFIGMRERVKERILKRHTIEHRVEQLISAVDRVINE